MMSSEESTSLLKTAIIPMIAFFDLFEYPLTSYEIWDNLDKAVSLEQVLAILEQELKRRPEMEKSALIQEHNGFYFLNGRAETVTTRQQRYNYSCRKLVIARRFTRAFSWCPFVQTVAVANSIGSHNLRDGSDIDFFIITAARRLWLSRLYCAGLAKILNSRPTAKTKQDKICLSFYISTEHLNLSDLRLSGADPYFDYWRRGLVLLYNKNKIYEQFLLVNHLTVNQLVSHQAEASQPAESAWLSKGETWAKHWQLKIMPLALRAAMNNSDGVIVTDSVLKLYQRDRRREFLEKYGNTLQEVFKKGA